MARKATFSKGGPLDKAGEALGRLLSDDEPCRSAERRVLWCETHDGLWSQCEAAGNLVDAAGGRA